jgi:magnesium transporter
VKNQNKLNFDKFVEELERKIDNFEEILDKLEDRALEGKLDLERLLVVKEEISEYIRKINAILLEYKTHLNTKQVSLLENERAYLTQLKEDLLNLLTINETIVNKKINNTLNKLAFVSMAFAPATFVAGLYGMNFKYSVIPPWDSPHGFLLAIIVIMIVTIFSIWLVNYVTLES